ncbi:MAG TPA: hypothetical protein VFC73_01385 [Syntrophomonadaceae bacterium]|nr:hypothetical protein [Syntrophomonadaceae bacterium]
MSLDSKKDEKQKSEEKLNIPDFTEMWKEMYFRTESILADSFKDLISTQTFVEFINKSLDDQLSYEKVSRQAIDKYMEMSPVPSKKDIARVAELVISLEEKIDGLEFELTQNMGSIADSLLKMVDYQNESREEIASLRKDLNALTKKLETVNKKVTTIGKDVRADKPKAKSKPKAKKADTSPKEAKEDKKD